MSGREREVEVEVEVEVEDLLVDHLPVLIALLVTLAAVGIIWLHFGR
jgi:hypothetical protein